jgi:hypothetical protein
MSTKPRSRRAPAALRSFLVAAPLLPCLRGRGVRFEESAQGKLHFATYSMLRLGTRQEPSFHQDNERGKPFPCAHFGLLALTTRSVRCRGNGRGVAAIHHQPTRARYAIVNRKNTRPLIRHHETCGLNRRCSIESVPKQQPENRKK